MNVSASPILSAGLDSKPTLKLNQRNYVVKMLLVGFLLAIAFKIYFLTLIVSHSWFRIAISISLVTNILYTSSFFREHRLAFTAHHLTIDGEELEVSSRKRTVRHPFGSIAAIERDCDQQVFQVKFKDRRSYQNIKGAGAEEFVAELSRQSGIEILRANL